MPGGEQVVRTPAGLAANGLNQVLLMCALHKGGTRKLKERYEHYFNLGVEVMIGKNNWDESVEAGKVPRTEKDFGGYDKRIYEETVRIIQPEYRRRILIIKRKIRLNITVGRLMTREVTNEPSGNDSN